MFAVAAALTISGAVTIACAEDGFEPALEEKKQLEIPNSDAATADNTLEVAQFPGEYFDETSGDRALVDEISDPTNEPADHGEPVPITGDLA
jgi:hypothetical protein